MADENHEPDPSHVLHVLLDVKGHRMAEKLFEHYVRDEACRSRLPAFLIQVDRVLGGMGGVPAEPEPDEGLGDGEEGDGADDGEDYADDEDLHAPSAPPAEAASADLQADGVYRAVLRALGRG